MQLADTNFPQPAKRQNQISWTQWNQAESQDDQVSQLPTIWRDQPTIKTYHWI